MQICFLLHDSDRFEQELRPVLSASWQSRSFEPCRSHCAELMRTLVEYSGVVQPDREAPLLCGVVKGLTFDRQRWRHLVGELLFYGAAEFPDIQTDPRTLRFLLAQDQSMELPRERSALIDQAHFGARDLFLGGFYRPESAGLNDRNDVARLADYLASCDPGSWTEAALPDRGKAADVDDLAEALAFARQCLLALRVLYEGAAARKQIVVCELL